MAIPWLVLLQSVPWTEVIKNAPKVADGARKLWGSIGRRPANAAHDVSDDVSDDDSALSPDARLTRLQTRLAALEATTAALHEQMRASSEIIKALAEQNAQLVERIETNRRRVVWLSVALLALVIFLALRSY
jgi:uncharacterized coiled-coil protein SlyX